MTAIWDIVQEFLTAIKDVSPDLYERALQYVKDLISEIHDFDHSMAGGKVFRTPAGQEPVARYLSLHSRALKDIDDILREARKRGKSK